jgi:hypothetical protein
MMNLPYLTLAVHDLLNLLPELVKSDLHGRILLTNDALHRRWLWRVEHYTAAELIGGISLDDAYLR